MTIPNTPLIIQPLADSELSATRGSNTGGDALPYKIRYSNPRGSADPAGQIRMVSSRIASESSSSLSAAPVWDSGWLGTPTITALPLGIRQAGVAELNGRIYVTGGKDISGSILSTVYSAPLQGGSLGSWRLERPMVVWPLGPNASGTIFAAPRYGHACCTATFGNSGGTGSVKGAGGVSWLICYSGDTPTGPDGAMIAATILADGTLGPWQTLSITNSQLVFATLTAVPNQYGTTALVLGGGATIGWAAQSNWWATSIRGAPANSPNWDVPVQWWAGLPARSATCHNTFYDWAQGKLIVSRGADGTTNQLGEYYLAFNVDVGATWAVQAGGAWTAVTASGGVAQNNAAGVYFCAPQKGATTSYAYLFGGCSSALLPPPPANAVNTVSVGTYTWDASGNLTNSSWAASAQPLPAVALGVSAAVGVQLPITRQGWGPFTDNNVSRIYTLGGGNGTTAALATAQSTTLPVSGGGDITAWKTGQGGGLVNGDLGTGGSIVADTASDAPAGAQLVTINHAAVTTPTLSLSDGDQVLQATYFIDRLGGDPSQAGYRAFAIGQAPTITNVSPANAASITSGQPVVSFAFNSGLGGSAQYAWQCQIKQGATVLFDSGIRYDQQNTVTPTIAPLLPPSQGSSTYTLIIQVWSTDFNAIGTSISTTSTTTFGTSAFAIPGVPGSFTATPSGANANTVLGWTAGSSATGYNVFYRRNGTTPWYLLAKPGNVLTYTAMDHIALGVAYDFGVSTLSAVPGESAMVTQSNVTIPLGAGTSYIHVATLGTTYGTWLQIQGSPVMNELVDAKSYLGFGQGAPVTRYGSGDYHTLDLAQTLLLDATPATLKVVQAILDQVQAGQPCCYRDALGGQLVVSFDAQQSVSIKPPFYRQLALKLTEVADTVGPYVTSGSAQGYQTLVGGRKPPLDTSERLL